MADTIDLMAHLAAHAPHAVPSWFRVQAPHHPPPPPLPSTAVMASIKANQHDLIQACHSWRGDTCWDLDDEYPELRAWCEQWRGYIDAADDRRIEIDRLRIAQWPWAWARMVADARPEASRIAMHPTTAHSIIESITDAITLLDENARDLFDSGTTGDGEWDRSSGQLEESHAAHLDAIDDLNACIASLRNAIDAGILTTPTGATP